MLILKRLLITLCVFLLVMSIYHDLSKNFTPLNNLTINERENNDVNYTIVQIEVLQGDTLLSINEQLNPQMSYEVDINQIIDDFTTLNPSVDPQHLIVGNKYYFPKYHL